MDPVRLASEELSTKLAASLEFVRALLSLSREKEAGLQAGDIERLRAATDKEEELITDLKRLDRDREICAGALAKAIGFFGSGHSLSELIAGIGDNPAGGRLDELKNELNEAMATLSSQNEKLRQLLALQIGYTQYMLNLIYIPRSRNNTYGNQGGRMDDASRLSLFDLHV